jgi:hypothetical protein
MSILYGIHDYGYSVIDILDYFFNFIKITHLVSEDQKYRIINRLPNGLNQKDRRFPSESFFSLVR